jgi:TonB family protein
LKLVELLPEKSVSRFRAATLFLLITSFGFAAHGQAVAPPAPAPTAAAIPLPSYPDTTEGLQKLMHQMLELRKGGDDQQFAAYAQSLALPNADDWFDVVFGKDQGPAYLAASARQRAGTASSAAGTFATLLNDKKTTIEAHKFENSCDEKATATEYPLLLKRESLVPLYDVRFFNSAGDGTALLYFAYVDGGFRYAGALSSQVKPLPKPRNPSGTAQQDETSERVKGGSVRDARLIHQVQPRYPREAKNAHITGDVKIHAIIGKDGVLKNLELVEGVCVLAKPAMEAVKDWRYEPTSLAGKPVEVDTTITVTFAL